MKLKKSLAALAMALPLAFVGATAQAAVTVMSFQDDDIDFLLTPTEGPNGTFTLMPKLEGNFAVGDVLLSVFEMPTFTIGGVNAIPAGQELTGIAAIQITSIPDNPGIGSVITFGPYTGGLNTWLSTPVVGGQAGGGAIVAMYLNDTSTFDLNIAFGDAVGNEANCTSLAQCVAEATTGNLLQVDGFAGDADEFWRAVVLVNGGANPFTVGGLSGSVSVAAFNAALTTFFNAPGAIAYQNIGTGAECPTGSMLADGCVAGPTITGPITGGNGLNSGIRGDGAFARSDIDATKLLQVPEPGTLALAGLSLLGLAASRRRKK